MVEVEQPPTVGLKHEADNSNAGRAAECKCVGLSNVGWHKEDDGQDSAPRRDGHRQCKANIRGEGRGSPTNPLSHKTSFGRNEDELIRDRLRNEHPCEEQRVCAKLLGSEEDYGS